MLADITSLGPDGTLRIDPLKLGPVRHDGRSAADGGGGGGGGGGYATGPGGGQAASYKFGSINDYDVPYKKMNTEASMKEIRDQWASIDLPATGVGLHIDC